MAEAFSWPEGQIAFWTGTATASAVVAYAQNNTLTLNYGWLNQQMLDGSYQDFTTGRRADLSVGALFTFDQTVMKIAQSATAVHARLLHHNAAEGSAGYLLYSGRLDSVALNGSEQAPYTYQLSFHANSWSAF